MIRALVLAAGLLFAGLVSTGCGEEAQCSEEVACGFGEVCIEGACVVKSCATSADCAMETYCSGGACQTGCSEDSDCYPGDACDPTTGACAEAGCRSSTLDCSFKEFCNTVTGDCYEAAGYYCLECLEDDDCGGNGNLCLGFGTVGDFCGVTCEQEEDCPAGFTCVEVGSGGQGETKQCITYCWLYISDTDKKGPPPPEAAPAEELGPILTGLDRKYATCDVGDAP